MIERVDGIDRLKQFSTISVLNRQGEEVQYLGACREFGKYVEALGPTDAVVLEASTGSFWWADPDRGCHRHESSRPAYSRAGPIQGRSNGNHAGGCPATGARTVYHQQANDRSDRLLARLLP